MEVRDAAGEGDAQFKGLGVWWTVRPAGSGRERFKQVDALQLVLCSPDPSVEQGESEDGWGRSEGRAGVRSWKEQ